MSFCVSVRERESVCVRERVEAVREGECVGVGVGVGVGLGVREGVRKGQRERGCVSKREMSLCVSVCVV